MRLSAGTLLLGLFAVMFGLLGAYVVQKELLKNRPEREVAKREFVVVPVAGRELEEGRTIAKGDVSIYRMTAEEIKEKGFTDAYMANPRQIIGRVVMRSIASGQTFHTEDLYPEGSLPPIAPKSGYRAVTVAVDPDAAVAGFARPGSLVDVYFRSDAGSEPDDEPEMTLPLIEAAEVLALNRETTKENRADDENIDAKKLSVTLAVTPRQVAALKVIEGKGSVTLVLRNKDDLAMTEIDDAPRTLNEILNRPLQRHKMQIYRGRQMSSVRFHRDERTGTEIAKVAETHEPKIPVSPVQDAQPSPTIIVAPVVSGGLALPISNGN
jgi:pilus assembly protein CpaB